MEELIKWLNRQKISFRVIDNEVIEIDDFGKMFVEDLKYVDSIFRVKNDVPEFNMMENPEVLRDEEIYFVAFPFGDNWYYFDIREDFRFNLLKYIGKSQPMKRYMPYVNLGVHTSYEILNGSGSINEWIKKAKFLRHLALGICDKNTMAGTYHLQKNCYENSIKPVFGYSCTLLHSEIPVDIKIYVQSQEGLQNLLRIQKTVMVDSENQTISLEELVKYSKGNVLVFGKMSSYWLKDNLSIVERLKECFNHVYYQVNLSEYKAERLDLEVLKATKFYFDNLFIRERCLFVVEPVLINDCYYLDKDDAGNKIMLNKIASGAAHWQSDDQYYKDTDELYADFEKLFDKDRWGIDWLFKECCLNTMRIACEAYAHYDTKSIYMPKYILSDEEKKKYSDSRTLFHALLKEGLKEKVLPESITDYKKRMDEEVYIIESTDNVDYFLIQWDIVREARKRYIKVGIGRGSAGGSLVAYLLGITSIDPIKYNLLFSRFLVPERCGLQWKDNVTKIDGVATIYKGFDIIEVATEHAFIQLDHTSSVVIKRGDVELCTKAFDLREGDELILDTKDKIWKLKY